MRTPSNDLHELILSLSRNEKSYFKKKSGSFFSDEKIYLMLFDAIDKYGPDEKKLQRVVKIKALSKAKHYLYQNILKCLRTYHKDLSINTELTDMLRDVELLYKKALFGQCTKLLARVQHMAEKENNDLVLLQICEIKNKISRSYHIKNSEKINREIQVQQQHALESYTNFFSYSILNNRIFSFLKTHESIRSKEMYAEVISIANSEILKDETKAISERSKGLFYNTNIILAFLLGDYEKACYYSRKKIKLLKANPVNDDYRRRYLQDLNNLAIAETMSCKYEDATLTINKINNVRTVSKEIEVLIFQFVSINRLNLMIQKKNCEKAYSILPEIERGLKYYKGKLNSYYQINIYGNLSKVFFLLGDYKKSLEWINPLVIGERIDVRPNFQCQIRIFYLLIHYELKDFELLSYLTVNTYRFIKKMKGLYSFEETILSFMKKISLTDSGDNHIQLFKQLKNDLLPLKDSIYDRGVLEDFDFLILWVESKINKIPYAEFIRQQVLRK